MGNLAIEIHELSKAYKIAHLRQTRPRYKTLQEDLLSVISKPFARFGNRATDKELFWALKDISLDVRHGEVLGIIGRNGAGKSTLLKILSRITEPTTGYAKLYGRIGSLLEVGTGFHPELTGRENIYLNGAILGMHRKEIERKFDEIVDFAEVTQFLDTPVKRYSSGMYVRLAFAVAAHLESEILVVDEVLAVGDASFQEKCLGKMNSVAREGRSVLFVSHNMASVQHLCNRGAVLEAGQVVFTGNIAAAIARYIESTSRATGSIELAARQDRRGDQSLRFVSVGVYNEQEKTLERILSGQNIKLRFYYESQNAYKKASVNITFNVYSPQGVLLTNLSSKDVGQMMLPIGHAGYFECEWPRFNLRSGTYTCALFCEVNGVIVDWLQAAFQLQVEDGDFFSSGSLPARNQGDVLVNHYWSGQTKG